MSKLVFVTENSLFIFYYYYYYYYCIISIPVVFLLPSNLGVKIINKSYVCRVNCLYTFFRDIPVSEEILNWHQHTTVRRNRALYSPIKKISGSSIGKYKKKEHQERLNEFMKSEEAVALLEELGYEGL